MMRDSAQVPIEVGQEVAYNRSGDVIRGTVVGISASAIRIAAHPEHQQGRDDTKPSRVRHGRSVLVLR